MTSGRFSRLGFSWLVAQRYLWAGRREAAITVITWIAILGVAVGVITLNVVMAVMTGFQHELKSKILGADAHVVVRSILGEVRPWREAREEIKSVPQVTSVSPFTSHQALLQTKSNASGVLIRGVEAGSGAAQQLSSYLSEPELLKALWEDQSIESQGPQGGIVIGGRLAELYGLAIGDTVTLLAPQASSTPFGLMPRFRRFRVVAIYRSGLVEYENGVVYVALSEAQSFYRLSGAVTGLEIRVDDVERAPLIAEKIFSVLNDSGFGSFVVRDWTKTNQAFFEAFKLEKRVYFIVLLLIIVMASFSIVSSLVMIVVEKRKDIAIMRTLGASSRSVANIFKLQGAVIGLIGVTVGTFLGVVACLVLREYGFPIDERIFQMKQLPVRLVPLNFILVALSSFAICCLAAIYPALKASRLEPAEALRYE